MAPRLLGPLAPAEIMAVLGLICCVLALLLVEPDLSTTTDDDGHFWLGSVAAGTLTLRATRGAATQQVTITVPAPIGSSYNVQLP